MLDRRVSVVCVVVELALPFHTPEVAGDGSTVEPHQLHSVTATPFSTGTPLSRLTLNTHTEQRYLY